MLLAYPVRSMGYQAAAGASKLTLPGVLQSNYRYLKYLNYLNYRYLNYGSVPVGGIMIAPLINQPI